MHITVMDESMYITDVEYNREIYKLFNECEKVDPRKLNTELMVLEDTESDLMDGYDSGWESLENDKFKDMFQLMLELWRVNYRIKHIRLRINLQNISFFNTTIFSEPRCDAMDTLMGNLQGIQIS
jgi:hypothetical protein